MESFISHTVKIKCAFCQLEIYRKNYKTHLKRKHPGRRDEVLLGHGQQKVSDFFGGSSVSDHEKDDLHGHGLLDEENETAASF